MCSQAIDLMDCYVDSLPSVGSPGKLDKLNKGHGDLCGTASARGAVAAHAQPVAGRSGTAAGGSRPA